MQDAARERDRAAQREFEDKLRGKLADARAEIASLEREIAGMTSEEVRWTLSTGRDGPLRYIAARVRLLSEFGRFSRQRLSVPKVRMTAMVTHENQCRGKMGRGPNCPPTPADLPSA
jgi:hypothetical protein